MEPKAFPLRIVINAVEGFGKTTIGAYSPNPGIIMLGNETGYETLLAHGRVPQIMACRVQTWGELLNVLDDLEANGGIETLVLDAIGGAERACHEHVCERDFHGVWGEKGFGSYMRGYDLSVTDWMDLLSRLDRLRERRGITVVMLSHAKIQTFNNPLGENFDRYVSDVHHKTWSATHKWADVVMFGTFLSVVDKENAKARKGKGVGGTSRILYTEHRDSFDAKNRLGMAEAIDLPDDPAQSWKTIEAAMRPGKAE